MPAATTTALRSDLRRMVTRTTDLKAEASAVLSLAEQKQWIWSPDAGTWSMALTLDHLNSVNQLLLPRLEEALERIRTEGYYSDAEPRYALAERFFIRLLSPNPPFQLPVPPIYVPTLRADPVRETGEPFIGLLDRIQGSIEMANGLDLKKAKIVSPASPLVRLTAGASLEAMVAHNEYHWAQVRALLDHPNFPPR
jgi:DinB superfamily